MNYLSWYVKVHNVLLYVENQVWMDREPKEPYKKNLLLTHWENATLNHRVNRLVFMVAWLQYLQYEYFSWLCGYNIYNINIFHGCQLCGYNTYNIYIFHGCVVTIFTI